MNNQDNIDVEKSGGAEAVFASTDEEFKQQAAEDEKRPKEATEDIHRKD